MIRSFILLPRRLGTDTALQAFPRDLEPAREELVQNLREALGRLASFSYSDLKSKVLIQEPGDVDSEELARLMAFPEDVETANNLWLSLQALDSLVEDITPSQTSQRWSKAPWAVRAEILARRFWFEDQRSKIAEGVKFSDPFLGVVSERNTQGRKTDREYHQLINFLHSLAMETGNQLLIEHRGETPDFKLADQTGQIIGVEVSEVPCSQKWADLQDDQEEVLQKLRPIIDQSHWNIWFNKPVDWAVLRNNWRNVKRSLERELRGSPKKKVRFGFNLDSTTIVEVEPGSGAIGFSSFSTGADEAASSAEIANAISRAVGNKLSKNGRPRKRPRIRPCYLVLYPNTDKWYNHEDMWRRAEAELPAGWNSHFDQIWLIAENYFGKLVPAP